MAIEHKMLQLNKIVLAPNKVSAIPDADRALMIGCGHMHNELVTLLGVYRAVVNTKCSSAIEQDAALMQELTIAKLMAGKLWESWEFMRKGFFNGLSKEYEPILAPDTADALKNIKQYFNTKNCLSTLRNQYSFHYEIEPFKQLPDGWDSSSDELKIYVGNVPAQTLFYFSEAIINRTMLLELGAGSLEDGVQRFWGDLTNLIDQMLKLFGGIFFAVVEKYIAKNHADAGSVFVGVLNPPAIEDTSLPFFVTTTM